LEKNGHATRAPAIVMLFVSNPCSWCHQVQIFLGW
jgi:hypothetical protein